MQRVSAATASGVHSELLPRPCVVSITRMHIMHHVTHAQSWTHEVSKKHSVPFNRRMEFTVSKLRRSGNHQGLYMLRCSPRDYDKYFMSFVVGVSSVNVCGEHSISHITAMQCNSLFQPMTAYIQADIKYEVRCLKSLE